MLQREIDSDMYNLLNSFGFRRTQYTDQVLCKNIEDTYGIDIKNFKESNRYISTSYVINDFINEFVKIIKPKTILDPSIGLGFTMREVSETLKNKISIDGIEINTDVCKIGKILSKDLPINYIEGDSINILKNVNKKYDFIFGDLPFGIRIPGIKGDGELEIMKLSLYLLNNGGYAIFTIPDKFFFRENKDFFNNENNTIVGTIRIPVGLYNATISPNLIIFKKGKSDKVFLGKLNEANAGILVKNFFEGRGNADSRYLDVNQIESYTWEKQLWYESINRQLKSGVIKPIEGFIINWYQAIDLENTNCVYIDTMGKHEVYTVSQLNQIFETMEKYKNRYLQVILPEGYNKEIFAAFYNSKSNKKLLDVYGMGIADSGLWNRIYSIKEIKLYYPVIEEKKSLSVVHKINDLKNILDSLSLDLDTDFIGNIEGIDSRLNKIHLLDEDELLFYNFPTSIKKQYQLYKNQFIAGHYHQAFDFINHIFLSCSILCICILWGGLVLNEDILNKYKQQLVDSVRRFDTIGFGDLAYLYQEFIKVYNKILNDDENSLLISSIYGTDDLSLIQALLNKKIPSYISEFGNNFRNNSAHSGATTEELYKKIIEEKVDPLLKNFISTISVLRNVSIFICGDGYYNENSDFEAVLTLFRGDTPKNVVEVINGKPQKNKLYFKIADSGNPIPMPCLIQYDKISVNDFNESSYFYNKVGKREIHYHTYEFIDTGEKTIDIERLKIDPLFEEILKKFEKKRT